MNKTDNMPTFQRCDESVNRMAKELMQEFETHKPLVEAKVKFDFVFAYADLDDKTQQPKNDALVKNGVKCLGIARKLALKDRALDRGDAEVALDGDWWREANMDERRALLDHEIHHIAVKTNRHGMVVLDDLGRPKLFLRPHDYEFGWFKVIAARHQAASQERKQAEAMMTVSGQYFWPQIATVEPKAGRIKNLELAR